MIDTAIVVRLSCDFYRFSRQVREVTASLAKLAKVFEDRDKWFTVYEGQWPDKFVVLNRFVRTGLRPPFILND